MRLTTLAIALATLALSLVVGCGAEDEAPESETFFETLSAPTVYDGQVDHQEVGRLNRANQASAFRFYRELRTKSDNLIFSPLSFSRVFAGYHDGQHEAAAFEALFGFDTEVGNADQWDQLFYLATEHMVADPAKASSFESSDIYWVDATPEEIALGSFDRVHKMNLSGDPEGSTELINQWIEDRSGGMLVDFLEEGIINSLTSAVATNVVYFVGRWTQEFSEKTVLFRGAEGDVDKQGFMGRLETQAVVAEDVTMLVLPYADGYRHVIVMPHSDFETYANAFDEVELGRLTEAQGTYEVSFSVPEFQGKSEPNMVAAIGSIREETGTTGGTLSGAFMETYIHKAAIEFTREGTRAAAASVVVEYLNNAPEPADPLTVDIDKPFIHMIMDDYSQSILFLGEVTH